MKVNIAEIDGAVEDDKSSGSLGTKYALKTDADLRVARALGVASEQSRIARKEWFIVAIVTVVAVALDGVVSARSDFIHATGA